MSLLAVRPPQGALALADLVDDVEALAAAAKAAGTRRAYARDMVDFSRFATAHGLVPFPTTPQAVALYVAHLARSVRYATIARRLVAISQAHKTRGHDSPAAHPIVREAMKGVARTIGTAQNQKAALRTSDIREIARRLPSTVLGQRDRALMLVGFAGALRRSELVALTMEDVRFEREGLVLLIRRSKTDQEAAGHELAVPFGQYEETCPVRALQTWLVYAGIEHGPLFRAVDNVGRVGLTALSTEAVAQIVKRHARGLGYDPADYAGHSLRAGFATAAIEGGASEAQMMRQTRHRSVEVARRYVRLGSLWRDHAGTSLGL